MISLPDAFGFDGAPEMAAVVGGGGKTSLMFALARALETGVLTGTTTRIFRAQMKQATAVTFADDLSALAEQLQRYGWTLLVGAVEGEKALAASPALFAQLWRRPDVRHVIVEADGSRMRPCKAPAAHEPVIPQEATLVIPVVGIDALGKAVADVAHRPELVCRLTGLQENDLVTEEALATLLAHPQGGLKNVPAAARVVPLINKVEDARSLAAARRIAQRVLAYPDANGRVQQVVLGAVQTEQPVREVMRRVTAVVLAAGEARRMGQLKQLLPWENRTVLGQTLRQVAGSLADDMLVVTGHEAKLVATEAARFAGERPLRLVHNPQYQQGEMLSSLQAGVKELEAATTAVLVILADQPMVETDVYNQLLVAYWQGRGDLIVPVYKEQRGNPVLIGQRYFQELLALPAGSAPRALLQAHPHELVFLPVQSDTVLRDLDTWAEYERWAGRGP